MGVGYVFAPLPGLTRARNTGARFAQGDIVAYIDDDSVAEPDWLANLVSDFSDAQIAAVTGRVRYMRSIGESRVMSEKAGDDDCARPRARFERGMPNWFCKACFGGIGDGGNMAFRRKVIAEIGFDERLGRGRTIDSGDEHVVFAKVLEQGYAIAHQPNAVVRHPIPSTLEALGALRIAERSSSIAYLLFVVAEFRKHRFAIARYLGSAVVRRLIGNGAASLAPIRLGRYRVIQATFEGIARYRRARRESPAPVLRPRVEGKPGLEHYAEPAPRSR
jgi:cellulose synthase/poly-beta-1,6-N-acetylglucosamine synthase-like glycosyltransferase